jgi:hypothetical protein
MNKYITTSNISLETGLSKIPDAPPRPLGMSSGERYQTLKYYLHSWKREEGEYIFVWELK